MLFPKDCARKNVSTENIEALADIKKVWAIAATAQDSWDPATLRRDQLSEQDIGPILQQRINNVKNEKTMPIAAPHTRVTGPNGCPFR
jgi:hypothetical protein